MTLYTRRDCSQASFQHVHNHLPFPLPTSVLFLLSKGLKYVPDLQSAHWTDFNGVGKKLQKALQCRAFFGDRPMPPKRFAKLRLQSSWSPPATARGKLVHNMFRHAIEQWHPVAKARNWSCWDRQAMKWLKQHRSTVKVCDSDKNMGVSLHMQQERGVWNTSDKPAHHFLMMSGLRLRALPFVMQNRF